MTAPPRLCGDCLVAACACRSGTVAHGAQRRCACLAGYYQRFLLCFLFRSSGRLLHQAGKAVSAGETSRQPQWVATVSSRQRLEARCWLVSVVRALCLTQCLISSSRGACAEHLPCAATRLEYTCGSTDGRSPGTVKASHQRVLSKAEHRVAPGQRLPCAHDSDGDGSRAGTSPYRRFAPRWNHCVTAFCTEVPANPRLPAAKGGPWHHH